MGIASFAGLRGHRRFHVSFQGFEFDAIGHHLSQRAMMSAGYRYAHGAKSLLNRATL